MIVVGGAVALFGVWDSGLAWAGAYWSDSRRAGPKKKPPKGLASSIRDEGR